jgi:hypothetical protein
MDAAARCLGEMCGRAHAHKLPTIINCAHVAFDTMRERSKVVFLSLATLAKLALIELPLSANSFGVSCCCKLMPLPRLASAHS